MKKSRDNPSSTKCWKHVGPVFLTFCAVRKRILLKNLHSFTCCCLEFVIITHLPYCPHKRDEVRNKPTSNLLTLCIQSYFLRRSMTTVFSKYIQHQFVKRPVLFETADSEKNLFDEMQTTVSLTHTHTTWRMMPNT